MSDYSRLFARIDELTARAERAEADVAEYREVVKKLSNDWPRVCRAEAAIERVRLLAQEYVDAAKVGGFGQIPAAQILAALDSTDPPSDAPGVRVTYGGIVPEPPEGSLVVVAGQAHRLDAQRPEERSDEGRITVADLADLVERVHRRSDSGLPADGEERK